MPRSPTLGSEGPLRLAVASNGKAIGEQIRLVALQTQHQIGRIPSARLEIEDGDMPSGTWPVADRDDFAPGSRIRIAASYGDEAPATLFEGLVTQIAVKSGADGMGRLIVECRHAALKMTAERRHTAYAGEADGVVVQRLIQRHGLAAAVEIANAPQPSLMQLGCTDWDFIVARAEANDLHVIADPAADTVRVRAPQTAAGAVLKLSWGVDLIGFEAKTSTETGIDRHAGNAARADDGLVRGRGRLDFQGSPLAQVGTLIELEGLGARCSGKVYVTTVEHRIDDGQWLSSVAFGPAASALRDNAEGLVVTRQAQQGADGLVVGVVAKAGTDPAGEGRVQITLPLLGAGAPPIWARVQQFQASAGFGAFFMPEVGDEVVVGFIDDDPALPVVLGSLYSSRRRPPYPAEAALDQRALVTRCGHRIELDERDRVITLTTPAKNRVVLSDQDASVRLEDQHGNRVELGRGGITISTPHDLKIAAQGSVSVDARSTIGIRSAADLQCAGLNVACDAEIGFSGKGKATAELSAAGQTTVKGALVMIN